MQPSSEPDRVDASIIRTSGALCYASLEVSEHNTHSPADPAYRCARLLSLASHELRTPASVAAGYVKLLLREGEPALADHQRQLVAQAEKAIGHLVDVAVQMSELAKLEDGSASMSTEPFDLFALLANAAENVHDGEDRGVGLRLEGDAGKARLEGDPARFRAGLGALLSSVLREQPGPCTIVARCSRIDSRPPSASVTIARAEDVDRVAAMPAPEAAFDELRGGMGLSLPIARRVIESHGGRIWSPLLADADRAARGAIVLTVPLAR